MFKLFIHSIEYFQYYLSIEFECRCAITFDYSNRRIGYIYGGRNIEHNIALLSGSIKDKNENNNSH